MSESLQDQLEEIKPLVRKSPGRINAESYFETGDSSSKRIVDWERAYNREVEKVLEDLKREDQSEEKCNNKDAYLKYAITGCLTALAGSCLYMLKKACINDDKSPKFKI